MEKITYTFPATKNIDHRAHVGVVGSGDLEVMMEPSDGSQTEVTIRTGITGFKNTWEAVIQRFFSQHDVAAKVRINDFGATPGVVAIRLAQALEVSTLDSNGKC
ncbi:malonate decarboxylase subunit delta [Domibacillus epiphyticus]|uniref:Malonate decarboxylase acyl carrier protein n=1 Tax=Domibacillus epiphyticus TaxID=1714355 RepID=A0A1V2ABC0_9BACI|nr:malonate decarboxylase subunit delta [Domibacillus epiphyticus]OMP68295.1 malonate decarboxylase acyl carrier protein [Domibacillus epiphyticus]